MKIKIQKCESCEEETNHTFKKRFAHKGRSSGFYLKKEVTRCKECGKTSVRNKRTGNYTKKLGGSSHS